MAEQHDSSREGITRRELLKGAALGGALLWFPALGVACGGDTGSSGTSPSASASGAPKKGGALRIGIVGGSAKDNVDGQIGTTEPEICLYFQLYDALLGWDQDYQLQNLLAEEVTPNADASVWTVKLREGVTFHDGKTMTADDVIFSYKRIIDPKDPKSGASSLADLPMDGIRKVDDYTVEFQLSRPNSVFNESMAHYNNSILPMGFDPAKAVGTGPFKLTDFRPGEQFTFDPNPDYFGQVPWVDSLTVIEFADTTARVNALLGGSVDAISQLPSAQVEVVKGSGMNVLVAETGGWQPFTMRIDKKPFDDVRVRQAFRSIVDREAMIEQAYAGFGAKGNDMYAPFDPGTPKDLTRDQDLEQARALLKQAGYDNDLTVTLNTSDAVGSAAVAAAQVFAEQAKGAGVTVKVNKVDPGIFYGDNYLQWDFAQDFWFTRNYLAQTFQSTVPGSPFNETHWKNDEWLAIVKEATATADTARRNELIAEAQTIEFNEGGYIVWAFNDQVDAYSDKLGGVVPDKFGTLSGFHFNKFYFA